MSILDKITGKENLPSMEDLEKVKDVAKEPSPERKRRYDQTEDPNQEGSTVRKFNEDGKFMRRIPIELQGLSSELLPPITKRRIARYEVCGKDKVDPLTGQIINPVPPLIIPGKFVVFDPFDDNVLKRHKTLKNVTRFENVNRNGVNLSEEVVDDIIFENGMKTVAIERNYLEYVLLELHPLNESNRWRDTSVAPAFRRIDITQRKWSDSQIGMDLRFEAEKAVVDLKKPEDIIDWAHAASIPTIGRMADSGENSIKYDLRKFARDNPKEFFALNKNSAMSVRIAVMDAVDLGLIEYNVDRRKWLFATDGEFICQHIPGANPEDDLIKNLQKDDYKEAYVKLQKQLNYFGG